MLLVFVTAIAALSTLTTTFADMIVREKRDSAPAGFILKGAAPTNQLIDLRVALVQSDIEGLEKALYDVSTPGSDLYGQHLSKEDVENLVRPKNRTVSMVNAFFVSHNITTKVISPAGNWLSFSVPISKANEMFDSQYGIYEHIATGRQFVRTLSYSIPKELEGHLDLVHPTVTFDPPITRSPTVFSPIPSMNNLTARAPPASCTSIITPTCLQALYGIPATPATRTNNVLAVSGFLQQFAQQADLTLFLKNFRPDLNPNTTFSEDTIDGGMNPQGPGLAGVEADLDIEYTVGIASGVPVLFASVGTVINDGLMGFLDLMNAFNGLETAVLPTVLTTSYNGDENNFSALAQA